MKESNNLLNNYMLVIQSHVQCCSLVYIKSYTSHTNEFPNGRENLEQLFPFGLSVFEKLQFIKSINIRTIELEDGYLVLHLYFELIVLGRDISRLHVCVSHTELSLI